MVRCSAVLMCPSKVKQNRQWKNCREVLIGGVFMFFYAFCFAFFFLFVLAVRHCDNNNNNNNNNNGGL